MTFETVNKVARITLLFWLMKIVATTLGETLGDFISMTLNLGYTTGIAITLSFFLAVLIIQLFVKKYLPPLYWCVIIATTTLGTEISDFLDRTLKLGYAWGSLLLVSLLMITLAMWYRRFKNLRVFPIADKQKEIFYWIAILFSNSLGTAFGDFLGDNLGLSYLHGAMITAGVIVIVVSLHYFTRLNQQCLFWIAFIFTRPFGATLGDFLTKPVARGGLDLGTLISSLIAVSLMLILLALDHFQTKNKKTSAAQTT